MLQAEKKKASLPSELKRISSTQFKALKQGLPSSITGHSFWRRQVHIKRVGRIRLWLLALLASLVTTAIIILSVQQARQSPRRARRMNTRIDRPFQYGCADPVAAAAAHPRENAAFVVLARNAELKAVLQSINSLEAHFNQWFNYPYVFLNDQPFSTEFQGAISNATAAKVSFGHLNATMWGFPSWADQKEYKEAIAQQGDRAIMYGDMESYHHMCRFFSGFMFHHPLVRDLEYYWRVEPEVEFFCDLTYDPFRMMKLHGKVYGFVIALKELVETVPNLFRYTAAWKRNEKIKDTSMWPMVLKRQPAKETPFLPMHILRMDAESDEEQRVSPDGMEGDAYNMCHFWSNFEIARVDFFRSERYTSFFNALDKTGGFWTERWGDAPVHTLGAALLLEAEEVHYFRDIGYQHTTIMHCPANALGKQKSRPKGAKWPQEKGKSGKAPKPDPAIESGCGCRCTCPRDVEESETLPCINDWAHVTGGWLE